MEKHVLKEIFVNAKDFDHNSCLEKCVEWLKTQLASRNCFRLSDKRPTKCQCLQFLNDDANANTATAAAEYIIKWKGMKNAERKQELNTWLSYSSVNPDKKMRLPLVQEEGAKPIEDIFICRNALFNVLNVGKRMAKTAATDPGKKHGNTGKTGAENNRGKKYVAVQQSLHSFFTDLKEEGLPFATRMVREKTGLVTRDDDPNDVALPPHLSKR